MSATTANTIRPDFKHRLDGDITNSLHLSETISMMAFRAKGVLELITVNIESDTQASDAIVSAAIHAAIAEIEDIKATVQAHHSAVRAMGEA